MCCPCPGHVSQSEVEVRGGGGEAEQEAVHPRDEEVWRGGGRGGQQLHLQLGAAGQLYPLQGQVRYRLPLQSR